jgi:hypothetical protein
MQAKACRAGGVCAFEEAREQRAEDFPLNIFS